MKGIRTGREEMDDKLGKQSIVDRLLRLQVFQGTCDIMGKCMHMCVHHGIYKYKPNIYYRWRVKRQPVEKCKTDVNSQSTEGQILMASKPGKRCLASLLKNSNS